MGKIVYAVSHSTKEYIDSYNQVHPASALCSSLEAVEKLLCGKYCDVVMNRYSGKFPNGYYIATVRDMRLDPPVFEYWCVYALEVDYFLKDLEETYA